MGSFEQQRNKKLFEIITILKLIYIILSMVGIWSAFEFDKKIKSAIQMPVIVSIVLFIILLYFSWVSNHIKNTIDKQPKIVDIIETIIMLAIFIVALKATGLGSSNYKLLSIFIVLIGAIQFGRNYSLSLAILLSIIILIVDFISGNSSRNVLSGYFESDLVLLSALFTSAFILGLYVEVEKEHSKELKNLANIDELTGLFNHRYFQEHLEKSMINADKNKEEISLLFMDIDYFKNFNDINGHQAGDVALRQIGDILKKCVRKIDIVARYGGEEFAIILPDTKEEDAIKIGERIRESIQNTYFIG
ncbi:GGDEF domain-containing protein, partial [Romboutsia sp.]|uniref:GGDEF domain-containing protein n=1 Tax=Romboutsia sp. TaxID=1965302 RepID=UPI003F3B7AC9